MHIFTDSSCRKHVNANSPVESPERYEAMVSGLEDAANLGAELEYHEVESATEEQMLRVHTEGYLDLIHQSSSSGGGLLDGDTATNEHSWDVTRTASGAAIGAVEMAMDGETSFAVVRPPGHHAGADYAMGFCLTNHAAVAAAHARHLGAERVAVLDWDVHHGNGTQDIFYDRDDVLYLSVHRGGMFYPGTGRVDEVGEGEGEGFTVNVPLRAGTGSGAYGAVMSGVFAPILREYSPDIIVVSAGYDAHERDPLGGMRLSSEDFGRYAGMLSAVANEVGAVPLAFVMEGGYDLAGLKESVTQTILGASPEAPIEAMDTSPVEDLKRHFSAHWKSLETGAKP